MQQLVRLLFGLLFFPVLLACHATPALEYLPALRGDYFKHDAVAVGRAFHIYVAYPEDYAKNPEARYPVVYSLDGDSLFPIHATYHRLLNYDEGVPRAIVVGIAYGSFDPSVNKRGYDFSAPAADASSEQGGAPAIRHSILGRSLFFSNRPAASTKSDLGSGRYQHGARHDPSSAAPRWNGSGRGMGGLTHLGE